MVKTIYIEESNYFIVKSKPSGWRKVGESENSIRYRGSSITIPMNNKLKKTKGGIRDRMGNIKTAIKAKQGYVLKYD